jgi:hypothetical protein
MTTKQPWEFSTEESEQYVRDTLEKLAAMPWNHHRGGDWEEKASEEDEAIDKAFEHAGAFGFYEADVLARVIEEIEPDDGRSRGRIARHRVHVAFPQDHGVRAHGQGRAADGDGAMTRHLPDACAGRPA